MVGGPVVSLETVGVLPLVELYVGDGVGESVKQMSLKSHVPWGNTSSQQSKRVAYRVTLSLDESRNPLVHICPSKNLCLVRNRRMTYDENNSANGQTMSNIQY